MQTISILASKTRCGLIKPIDEFVFVENFVRSFRQKDFLDSLIQSYKRDSGKFDLKSREETLSVNRFKKLFLKKDEKILREQIGPSVTVIASGTEIKGSIDGQDTLRISGYFVGDIHCARMVWIDPDGRVDGTIIARRVINEGEIKGNIVSAEQVEIRSKGRMIGDITAAKIVIAHGCLFDGEATIQKEDNPIVGHKEQSGDKL